MQQFKWRTVNGPIDALDVQFPLLYEHIFSEKSFKCCNETQVDLTMENLAQIYTSPESYSKLYCLDSIQDATDEFKRLEKQKCTVVVDMTLPQSISNLFRLQKLSQETKIQIIVGGMSSPTEQDNAVTLSHSIQRHLKFGIDGSLIQAGFIGPVETTSDLILEAVADAQRATGAPVVFSTTDTLSTVINTLIDKFKKEFGGDVTRTIVCHSDLRSVELNRQLLELGVVLSFDMIGYQRICRRSLFHGGVEPLSDARIATHLCQLLQYDQYLDQIFISNGICMKTQLKRFGGSGYTHVFQDFNDRLIESGLCSSRITEWRSKQAIKMTDLFQWWSPEETIEIPKDYLTCDICSSAFAPIEGTYYSKYTFNYCSLKCLRKHSKQGFLL